MPRQRYLSPDKGNSSKSNISRYVLLVWLIYIITILISVNNKQSTKRNYALYLFGFWFMSLSFSALNIGMSYHASVVRKSIMLLIDHMPFWCIVYQYNRISVLGLLFPNTMENKSMHESSWMFPTVLSCGCLLGNFLRLHAISSMIFYLTW